MYTIGQVAKITGFSPDTLRYYEKIGLLRSPKRESSGIRKYNEDNIQILKSLNCLKKTGLSLEDIKEFIQEGQCIENHSSLYDLEVLSSRSKILSEHLNRMEKQRREIDDIIKLTKKKLNYYDQILNGNIRLEELKEISN